MKIFHWTSSAPNFGDDLNLWLWHQLLGDILDEDANVLFVGIGSVLDCNLPKARKTIVLGAGAGYHPLPDDFGGPSWKIYGVRGPLTARFCQLSADRIAADPAILLPRVLPITSQAAAHTRPVYFVPHLHSAMRAPWSEICRQAGIELLDPRQDSQLVVSKLASARLVLAESMHAAIIADAYRVPWMPVWSSREINHFKWLDWAWALGGEVSPLRLPPASPLTWLDHQAAPYIANDNSLDSARSPIETPDALDDLTTELRNSLTKRSGTGLQRRRRNYLRVRKRVLMPLLAHTAQAWSARLADKTAALLADYAQRDGFLTPDRGYAAGLERLDLALEALRRDHAGR